MHRRGRGSGWRRQGISAGISDELCRRRVRRAAVSGRAHKIPANNMTYEQALAAGGDPDHTWRAGRRSAKKEQIGADPGAAGVGLLGMRSPSTWAPRRHGHLDQRWPPRASKVGCRPSWPRSQWRTRSRKRRQARASTSSIRSRRASPTRHGNRHHPQSRIVVIGRLKRLARASSTSTCALKRIDYIGVTFAPARPMRCTPSSGGPRRPVAGHRGGQAVAPHRQDHPWPRRPRRLRT